MAGARHLGGMAGPVRGPGAARAPGSRASAEGPRRAAADERDRSGVARRGAGRRRRPAAAARERAAEVTLRAGVRRQPSPGAWADVRRGVRTGSRGADVPAEAARRPDDAGRRAARAARRGSAEAEGTRTSGTSAAATGGRRRDPTAVAFVSADRHRRVASARAVVLRPRRHACDHRPHPESRRPAGECGGVRRGGARLAGAGRSGCRDRRSRARPRRPARAVPGGRREGPRPRALPAAPEREPAALGHGAVGPGAFVVDGLRRDHPREQPDEADAGLAAAVGPRLFAVGAAEVLGVPISVPVVGDLPAPAVRGAGTAAEARPAHPRRAVPRGPGGFPARAQG